VPPAIHFDVIALDDREFSFNSDTTICETLDHRYTQHEGNT